MTKKVFSSLIDDRLRWLDSVSSIGDGWITGSYGGTQAQAPSIPCCEAAKELLTRIQVLFDTHARAFTPALTMGPIPTGGIGVEIVGEKYTIFANFFNDGKFEAERSLANGDFIDIECGFKDAGEHIVSLISDAIGATRHNGF